MSLFLYILILFLVSTPAVMHAVSPATTDSTKNLYEEMDEKHWTIGLPLWVPGFRGLMAVGGVEIEGEPEEENEWDRLFSSQYGLNFYLVGLVNYRWGKWSAHADMFSGSISKSVNFTLNDNTLADASIYLLMPRIHAGYDFLRYERPLGPIKSWKVYLGARYYHLEVGVNIPDHNFETEQNSSWFTGYIGTQIVTEISRFFSFRLSGDIGGFSKSNFPTYFWEASIHYFPTDFFSMNLGVMAIHINLVPEVSQDLKFRADLLGPGLGFAFYF